MRQDVQKSILCLVNALAWLFMAGCLSLVVIFAFSPPTHAAQTTPYKLNFQGRLTDNTGNVVTNGSYNMKLRLMSASSGGSNLWETSRTGSNRITITNGLFNVQLGDTVAGDPALSPSIFNTQTNSTVYLEIELPTPGTAMLVSPTWSEGPMTPRQLITSAPYAMNADTVDGIDGASLAQLSTSNTFTGANLFRSGSDSTTAFQIQKSDNTPLFVADTQNLALKVGGGDVSPDASPALLVLDYKNTSGDPSGTNGAMYYNSNTNKFRCYENGEWVDCVSAAYSPRKGYLYQTDLVAGSFSNGGAIDMTTIAAVASMTASNPGNDGGSRPGIFRLTSTASSGIGGVLTAAALIQFGSVPWSYYTAVKLPTASIAGQVYTYRAGFINAIQTPTAESGITNGCYMRYSHSGNGTNIGKWQGICRSGNVETASPCDTGVTPTFGSWDKLGVTLNSAGTVASFSVNNSTPCTVSTSIPTAAIGFGQSVERTAGTTSRAFDTDFIEVRANFTR